MDIYQIVINSKLFKKILNGNCKYYVFVNDKLRQSYKQENILTFVNEETQEKLNVKITGLLYFASIKEMLDMIGKDDLGYTPSQTNDSIEDQYFSNYKIENVSKCGLVAVKFEIE